jgi:hypothetical protein
LGALGASVLLGGSAPASETAFRALPKAMWVWKDRVLEPGDLATFSTALNISLLFLYVTPPAAEALLNDRHDARAAIARLRAGGRRIYAMAGEPEWALGPARLPEHAALLVRLQKLPQLFDGIHLDVEPNALPQWHDAAARPGLLQSTIRFYALVRSSAPQVALDAAVNPIFATLRGEDDENLQFRLAQQVRSLTIMAYRNRVQPAIDWAKPAVAQIARAKKTWRMGVELERVDAEPTTTWFRVPRATLEESLVSLNEGIEHQMRSTRYAGLAIHSFDGARAALGHASG